MDYQATVEFIGNYLTELEHDDTEQYAIFEMPHTTNKIKAEFINMTVYLWIVFPDDSTSEFYACASNNIELTSILMEKCPTLKRKICDINTSDYSAPKRKTCNTKTPDDLWDTIDRISTLLQRMC